MNKGFVSIIGIIILSSVLSISSALCASFKNEYFYYERHDLLFCEIYTINYVKKALAEYKESDEVISYNEFEAELKYEDVTCYITIYKDEEIVLKSVLVWDDIDCYISDYYYLSI